MEYSLRVRSLCLLTLNNWLFCCYILKGLSDSGTCFGGQNDVFLSTADILAFNMMQGVVCLHKLSLWLREFPSSPVFRCTEYWDFWGTVQMQDFINIFENIAFAYLSLVDQTMRKYRSKGILKLEK